MASTDSVAVDHSYDRLRQRAYLLLHIEHVKARHTVVADISATSLDVHVATRTERHVASSGQYYHPYALRFTTPRKRLRHLPRGAWCKGVAITRTVYRYLGYTVIFLKEYLLKVEVLYLFPFSCFHSGLFDSHYKFRKSPTCL